MDLAELYQDVILDHNRAPRNFGCVEGASHRAEGLNPLCGDRCAVSVALDEGGVIRDLRFEGKGCAISVASASLMTEALHGRTLAEADALFDRFRAMVMGAAAPAEAVAPGGLELGSLRALEGVKRFPARVKCASLPWHALKAALASGREQVREPVSTE